VTTIKIQNGILQDAKLVHSLDLSVGDLVLWPGKEFKKPKNDVIVKVMRNDFDHLNTLCCMNTTNIFKLEIYCGKYCNRCLGSSSSVVCDNQVHRICCNTPWGNDRAVCICQKNPICECF